MGTCNCRQAIERLLVAADVIASTKSLWCFPDRVTHYGMDVRCHTMIASKGHSSTQIMHPVHAPSIPSG